MLLTRQAGPLSAGPGNFLKRVHSLNRGKKWQHLGHTVSLKNFFMDKFNSRKYVESLGVVGLPELYLTPTYYKDVRIPEGKESMVLKPNEGVGAKGVLVLDRKSDCSFYESRQGEVLQEDEVHSQLESWSRNRAAFSKWIIEERLTDSLFSSSVVDYKFYAFTAGVPVCLVVYSHPKGYAWIDSSLNIVETGRYSKMKAPRSQVPPDMAEMFSVAGKVQSQVPSPFSRVDLYSTDKGIRLGEITPAPANPDRHFNSSWERRLNALLDDSLKSFV